MTTQKGSRFREHLFRRLTWEDLDKSYLRQLANLAREEDLEGSGLAAFPHMPGDATTSTLSEGRAGEADLVARVDLVACGLPLVPVVLDCYGKGCSFKAEVKDGAEVCAGSRLGTVSGPAGVLLQAERVILNFQQHLSGVASQTATYVKALGWSRTKLLDTRKTTPGFRVLEKYAVAMGGGWNHRIGLFDRIMLKDNHLVVAGATEGDRLANAVRAARKHHPELAVEVEVDTLEQIPPVLDAGADVIMLDNFSESELAEAVALIGDRAYTEASGGITLDNLHSLGDIGLDFISCGALIHQSTWKDIALDWRT